MHLCTCACVIVYLARHAKPSCLSLCVCVCVCVCVSHMQCFRLYTRQFFDREMPNVTPPEIQRTSLAGTVLYLKSLALAIDVLTFDFLDPPSRESLEVGCVHTHTGAHTHTHARARVRTRSLKVRRLHIHMYTSFGFGH